MFPSLWKVLLLKKASRAGRHDGRVCLSHIIVWCCPSLGNAGRCYRVTVEGVTFHDTPRDCSWRAGLLALPEYVSPRSDTRSGPMVLLVTDDFLVQSTPVFPQFSFLTLNTSDLPPAVNLEQQWRLVHLWRAVRVFWSSCELRAPRSPDGQGNAELKLPKCQRFLKHFPLWYEEISFHLRTHQSRETYKRKWKSFISPPTREDYQLFSHLGSYCNRNSNTLSYLICKACFSIVIRYFSTISFLGGWSLSISMFDRKKTFSRNHE